MERYDPTVAPDSKEWLALDEGEKERSWLSKYHRDARIELPKTCPIRSRDDSHSR